MAQQDRGADDDSAPTPPDYTSITGRQRQQANRQYEQGVLTPSDFSGMSLREAVELGFADYHETQAPTDIRKRKPTPGAMYFHTGWMSLETAAEVVEYYPEIPKNSFYPPGVAMTLASLPEETMISLGREQIPVIYAFTNRPPLMGLLKDAGDNVAVEVVEEFPREDDGECALAFDGRPGGDWHLIRVSWFRR